MVVGRCSTLSAHVRLLLFYLRRQTWMAHIAVRESAELRIMKFIHKTTKQHTLCVIQETDKSCSAIEQPEQQSLSALFWALSIMVQWTCIPSVTQVGRASQHMIEYARRDASRLKNTSIIYQTEFERNNV